MIVKFWGTRGSIPTSLSSDDIRRKIRRALEGAAGLNLANPAVLERYLDRLPQAVRGTAGGNTFCVEVRSGDQLLILDAGSGLRLLGLELMRQGWAEGGRHASLLVTHTHWDHIQGWPFFRPAFVPGNRLTFYSPFADMAGRLARQQDPAYFPVPLDVMSATLEFVEVQENHWYQIGRFRVMPLRLAHPGYTCGYRIEDGETCLVCATDSEYKQLDPASTEKYVRFFQAADLLIFDAQYSLGEALDKADWGHSTALMGAELAHRAGAKRLALVHHDPTSSDEKIWAAKDQAEAYLARYEAGRFPKEVLIAYDDLSLEL